MEKIQMVCDEKNNCTIKGAVEAMLFASGNSVAEDKISSILCISNDELAKHISKMNEEYSENKNGIRIIKLENEYQMTSSGEYNDKVQKLMNIKTTLSLSKAALETLAIIAYKQPCTRQMIEQLRGINPISSVNKLLELGLIEEGGSLPLPGNPVLFKTTHKFLSFLGISSLSQLPEIN